MSTRRSRFIVGVDIGGTFTDLVALDTTTGAMRSCKVPSTPPRYIDGVINALDRAQLTPEEVTLFKHGSTIATNAIIQRTGARTAVVTTEGFRDVLPAARAARVDLYDSDWDPSPPLVPRRHILTVPERMTYEGDVLVPLDEDAVRRAGRILHRRGMESIAVSFLHSYVNPAHEVRARELLEETCPGAYVYVSSETIPEVREFERTSTTVVNAYLGPIMERYLGDLAHRLSAWGYDGQILITHSGGGLMTCDAARRLPSRICQSGPAGGVMGGAHLGRLAGFPNLVTLDIGGTSADMSLIFGGEPRVANEWRVEFNIPITFPAVDLIAIGAGGGSVAWVDPGGALRSGPHSAGAVPGPACYGNGGVDPTTTDANLVLGRLSPEMFLGGDMSVRPDLARHAVGDRIASHFGFSVEEAAMSIVRVANASMMNAIRLISVQRGYDPRDFALLAFGGGGPLHAVELAQELEIPTVLVPRLPGLTSAIGVLDVDLRYDYVRPLFQRERSVDVARVKDAFAAMETEARDALIREGAAADGIQLRRTADVRYYGQISASVSVPVPAGIVDEAAVDQLLTMFLDQYRREYGYVMPRDIAEIEIVNARVSAQGVIHRREYTKETQAGTAAEAVKGTRPVYFQGVGFVDSAIYDRARLRWGARFAGPAIVEQWDSTTVVPPGATVEVDEYLNLVIHVPAHSHASGEKPAMNVVDERDPITFEILKNGFRALCAESSALVARVSYAPTITEGHDLSGALLSADAHLIAHGNRDQAPHIGGFEPSVRTIMADIGEPRPGEVYIFNDPYTGGAHVNDMKIIRPLFVDGALFAFAAHTGHWPDVGGALPGSFNPRATDCYSEGLRLPPLKLMVDEQIVPSTLKLIQMNLRCGAERLGDIHAQVQAGRLVERRLKEYVAKFGAATVRAAFDEIVGYTERIFRQEIGKLPDGRYEFVDYSDRDHMHPDQPRIRVHCEMRIEGDHVTFDFRGSDPQPRGPFGFPRAALHSAVYDGTLHCFPHLSPLNHGLVRAVDIESTPGSCVDILEPTPASGYACGAYEKVAAVVMACWAQAFASVNPRRMYAAGINLANLCLGGVHPKTKAPFVSYLWNEGGQGARSYKDGNSFQLMIFIGGATNQPVEVLERWYPIVFERCEAVQDSCGDGKFRGGLGIDRSFRADGDITLTMHGDRAEVTPFGLGGGTNGGPNVLRLNADRPGGQDLGMAAYGIGLKRDDRVMYRSNGGGGYGDPLGRDPSLVLEDVIDEWVSLERARDVYGVAVRVRDWETLEADVDEAETARLRALLAARPRERGLGPGQVHSYGERVRAAGEAGC